MDEILVATFERTSPKPSPAPTGHKALRTLIRAGQFVTEVTPKDIWYEHLRSNLCDQCIHSMRRGGCNRGWGIGSFEGPALSRVMGLTFFVSALDVRTEKH